jgi:hypothetical protein
MVQAYRQAELPGVTKEEADQLKLLSTLHYVYGAFVGLVAAGIGLVGLLPALLVSAAPQKAGDPPPFLVGGILLVIFGFIAALFLAKAVLNVLAGRALADRRNYTLVLVAACLSIPNFPIGTALGVFTLMLITKPAVKASFS